MFVTLKRYEKNPIITPIKDHLWESKAVFNAGAIYEGGKVHILYRAMSQDNVSVIGYASSKNGYDIDERLSEPIYVPREEFEIKKANGNSGCEDPRLTKIGETIYMCYTAFNSTEHPRVALTQISLKDFLNKKWNWSKPVLISPPYIDDKDACILEETVSGEYAIFHRFDPDIWIDYVGHLDFANDKYIKGYKWLTPRPGMWDSRKIGIAGPPIKIKDGWLLIYHGISSTSGKYRLGALTMAPNLHTISRLDYPIFEPEAPYEKNGQVSNVVFSCGQVVINGTLFVYYGGADEVIGVATANLEELTDEVRKSGTR